MSRCTRVRFEYLPSLYPRPISPFMAWSGDSGEEPTSDARGEPHSAKLTTVACTVTRLTQPSLADEGVVLYSTKYLAVAQLDYMSVGDDVMKRWLIPGGPIGISLDD